MKEPSHDIEFVLLDGPPVKRAFSFLTMLDPGLFLGGCALLHFSELKPVVNFDYE